MADRSELEALFVANLALIERLLLAAGRRQGLHDDDLADFASWAKTRLVTTDYAVLAQFRGESSLTSYLATVLTMAAREYRVAHWGRWRPSAAAIAQGPLAVRLETLVYRDGMRLGEAAQRLRTAGETSLSERALAAILSRLPPRRSLRGARYDPGDAEVPAEAVAGDTDADGALLRDETDAARQHVVRELADAIDALPPDDRVMLRLRYWKGASVADTARALGVPQRPLYRRLERILRAMRDRLLAHGVEAEHVRALLEESLPGEPQEPAGPPERDEPPARPSTAVPASEELTK